MEVEFLVTAQDYRGFYRYLSFRRNIGMKIAVIGLISFLYGYGLASRHFSLVNYLIDSLAVGLILFLLSIVFRYLIVLVKTRKALKRMEGSAVRRKIELTAGGLFVLPVGAAEPEQQKKFWSWAAVRSVGVSAKYVYIVLINQGICLIPRQSFLSAEEADHFVFLLEAGIEQAWGSKRYRAKKLYFWGLLGLIPNFGVIAGLILLFKGAFQFGDKILILIGASDILFTILFWWIVDSTTFQRNAFADLHKQMAQTELNTIFRYVEFYKIQHGVYPDSLEELDLKKDNIWIYDPIQSGGPIKRP
jgi:hypothetical protein